VQARLLLWITVAAAALASAVPAAAQSAASGALLFESTREGFSHLYAANADATDLRRVALHAWGGAWFPDGNRFAFLRPGSDGRFQIWIRDAATGAERLLVEDALLYEISPDGSEIAYLTLLEGGLVNVVDVTTGNTRSVVPATAHGWWIGDWSADGQRLVLPRGDDSLWIVERDGGNARRLTSGFEPVWSPDGTKIAFGRFTDDDEHWSLYVINADGTGVRQLTPPSLDAYRAAWSPDGRRLAFHAGEDDLYVADADGNGRVHLARGLTRETRISWAPDGNRLAVTRSPSNVDDVWIVDMNGTASPVTRGFHFGGDSTAGEWGLAGSTAGRLAGTPLTHAIPTESAVHGHELHTKTAITRFVAAGNRVAVVVRGTSTHCARPEVADFASGSVTAFTCGPTRGFPGASFRDFSFTGREIGWLVPSYDRDRYFGETLFAAAPTRPRPTSRLLEDAYGSVLLGDRTIHVLRAVYERVAHDGSLIRSWTLSHLRNGRLVRIRSSREPWQLLSAGSGRIALVERGQIVLLRRNGSRVAQVELRGCGTAGALAARTTACRVQARFDGDRLLLLRNRLLQAYSATTGRPVGPRIRLPRNARLTDAAGGIGTYVDGRTIGVVRPRDGCRYLIRPHGVGAVFVQIETVGLAFAYSLSRRLDGRAEFRNWRDVVAPFRVGCARR
jgi:Tol biopolymer transport system component